MKRILSCATGLLLFSASAPGWESSILHRDATGNRLVYHSDEEGNRIMDFSYAGYHNGEVELPHVPVVQTIDPVAGDNTEHIQAAIDSVAALPADSNGHRGALLLKPGTYEVKGEIYIAAGGVVVRGSGHGENPAVDTIIRPVGKVERRTFVVGTDVWNGWGDQVPGTQQNITSEFIPSGSRTFSVENASVFKVGDNVIMKHPATEAWLSAVNFGDTDGDPLWGEDVSLLFNRFITRIEGNTIEVDVPIYHNMDRALSQSFIYVYDRSTILEECGIENLRIDIETAGQYDNDHASSGISMGGTEDCWVRDVTVLHFSRSGINLTQSTRNTVLNCNALEPHALIEGGKRSCFLAGDDCNNILFKGCHGALGRQDFKINGGATVSGVVFTQCTGDRAYASSESHRRWGCAVLWDQIDFSSPQTDCVLGIGYNRGSWGTGHGWTGTGMVGWNVSGNHIVVQKPPIGQNFAIGCRAVVDNLGPWVYPVGFVEGTGEIPEIPSLYEAQLAERLTYGVAPDTPCKLKASHVSTTGTRFVALEWIDTALDEEGFILERSSDGGATYSVLANLPPNRVSFTDTTVTQDGQYIYRLHATNSTGSSAYGNLLHVNLAEPEKPKEITIQAEDYTGISGCEMKRTPHLGYTGLGYVDMGGSHTWFEWNYIDGGMGGTCPITLRYASLGDRPCDVSVNGAVTIRVNFTDTGDWSTWSEKTILIPLNPGANVIRVAVTSSEGGPNFDKLDICSTPVICAAGQTAPDQTAPKAFDGDNNTLWKHNSPYGSWIQYACPALVTVVEYSLTSGSDHQANDPKAWKLLGSNNGGTSWTVLDAQRDVSFSQRKETKKFPVIRDESYGLYRLEVTEVHDVSTADSVQLAEIGLVLTRLPPVTPDTGIFATAPYPVNETAIRMLAVTGIKNYGQIEYYFSEVSGNPGGTDSGWITSPDYTDTGLTNTMQYSYTVTLRNAPGNENTPSAPAHATPYVLRTPEWSPRAGSDGLWTTSTNWTGGTAPFTVDQHMKVVFNGSSDQECELDAYVVLNQLVMGDNGTDTGNDLRLTSGAVLISGQNPDGTLNWTAIGYNRPASLTVESGAVFKTADYLLIGFLGTGNSSLNIDGGTGNIATAIKLGGVADNTSCGFVTVRSGGQLTASGVIFNNTNSVLDVHDGSVVLNGNQTDIVKRHAASGCIKAYDGKGTLLVDYNTRNIGKTTITTRAPGVSTSPDLVDTEGIANEPPLPPNP